jgi:hypothetical protein
MGFRRDEVGKLLRKNRGTKNEGYARFPEAWFISAKHAMKARLWHFEVFLRLKFPWVFEKEPPPPRMKPVFLHDGMRWEPVKEPRSKREKRSAPAQSSRARVCFTGRSEFRRFTG